MTIQLTDAAGANPVRLVDGPAKATASYAQGPIGSSQEFRSTQQVQVAPRIRGEYANVFIRNNRMGIYPFAALRLFETPDAAVGFAASHPLAVQGKAVLQVGQSRKLTGGISSCVCSARGVAVRCDYEFTYGKVEDIAQ